jgi:hypothetical protein
MNDLSLSRVRERVVRTGSGILIRLRRLARGRNSEAV